MTIMSSQKYSHSWCISTLGKTNHRDGQRNLQNEARYKHRWDIFVPKSLKISKISVAKELVLILRLSLFNPPYKKSQTPTLILLTITTLNACSFWPLLGFLLCLLMSGKPLWLEITKFYALLNFPLNLFITTIPYKGLVPVIGWIDMELKCWSSVLT